MSHRGWGEVFIRSTVTTLHTVTTLGMTGFLSVTIVTGRNDSQFLE